MKLFTIAIVSLVISQAAASAQQPGDMTHCPMHNQHVQNTGAASEQPQTASHFEAVDRRGDKAMGFDQDKTTHHFILKMAGGIIRVETNGAADDTSRSSIRAHLTHIPKAFSQGDFEIPMFVHDQTPPGVSVMKNKKNQINYEYRELPAGGEIVITSSDRQAIAAIHEFLKFQIQDHRTGDSLSVQ